MTVSGKESAKARKSARSRHQRGLTLIEVVIAVALAAFLGLALLRGLSALTINQGKHSERVAALIAARRQIELVKQSSYDVSVTGTPGPAYSSLSNNVTIGDMPFALTTTAQLLETDVQLVTVVAGNDGNDIIRLQAYKVNR
ncbi:MAG: prepilin-type N-terminal cleavage/methylation domain-containing protein [Chloroflexi bacterium]|nr:prepilin-type N-terminal cleavage/methylation domain-containing protein [Chloroflexota bacterium]